MVDLDAWLTGRVNPAWCQTNARISELQIFFRDEPS
jgi:hypothetical protein